ncbi:hypothetical protein C9374_007054 [Naegleria lovaniensis]|uniref:Uncharacterized protein n=1 Tax=Naegleria lovaniensis TaxID=51637 RepID=A0AA88H2T6_NAELO|nr:uncharacterized protein C9374_007054 [Naegleria lovaniensis]KAG2393523.1 hypothetical protein C9374_007054 [Naegleria lovaniensis]
MPVKKLFSFTHNNHQQQQHNNQHSTTTAAVVPVPQDFPVSSSSSSSDNFTTTNNMVNHNNNNNSQFLSFNSSNVHPSQQQQFLQQFQNSTNPQFHSSQQQTMNHFNQFQFSSHGNAQNMMNNNAMMMNNHSFNNNNTSGYNNNNNNTSIAFQQQPPPPPPPPPTLMMPSSLPMNYHSIHNVVSCGVGTQAQPPPNMLNSSTQPPTIMYGPTTSVTSSTMNVVGINTMAMGGASSLSGVVGNQTMSSTTTTTTTNNGQMNTNNHTNTNNNNTNNNNTNNNNNGHVNTTITSSTTPKYTPCIRWSCAPSTAIPITLVNSNNSSGGSIGGNGSLFNSENMMVDSNSLSQTLIDHNFTAEDLKVMKGNPLIHTKLFCLSDQTLRDFPYLRPSVQTDNLYHFIEMENESSWLPNDRIAPKKTSHNCLVNDWLVFCSQDPQLLKLVGRYIGSSNNSSADVQLFADFVLVTSNNHDEDSRESLFGKQRFKGGIPLQMKLVRSLSTNNSQNHSNSITPNANMSPLLYFEKRINRESVNNKDAPSASGMGGKRVAQLRIYLKDKDQEICLVHSEGFWVRTKSREEVHRTSSSANVKGSNGTESVVNDGTAQSTNSATNNNNGATTSNSPATSNSSSLNTKKKKSSFAGFALFHGNGGRMKREAEHSAESNTPTTTLQKNNTLFNVPQQQSSVSTVQSQQQPQQQQPNIVFNSASQSNSQQHFQNSNLDPASIPNMSSSANSYGSSSYLSNSGSSASFANSQNNGPYLVANGNYQNMAGNISPLQHNNNYHHPHYHQSSGSMDSSMMTNGLANAFSDQSDYSSLGSTPNTTSHLSQPSITSLDIVEVLRNLSISIPNSAGTPGTHSRHSSFTSPGGLAGSASSTSSSSYFLQNSADNNPTVGSFGGLQSSMDTSGDNLDATIQKLDAAINLFNSMKDACLKMRDNQSNGDHSMTPTNLNEIYAQFNSSIQDKRKDKGHKRVRGNNEGAANETLYSSPQIQQKNHSLNVQSFGRVASSSAPNASTFNFNSTPTTTTGSLMGNNLTVMNHGLSGNHVHTNTSCNNNNMSSSMNNLSTMNNSTHPLFQNLNNIQQNHLNFNNNHGGVTMGAVGGGTGNFLTNNSNAVTNERGPHHAVVNFDGAELPQSLFNTSGSDPNEDIFQL